MAKFKVGDIVSSTNTLAPKNNGEVKYIACQLATPSGGKVCDKKTCAHANQVYVWVKWPNSTALSIVHENDLEDVAAKQMIGQPDTKANEPATDGDAKVDVDLNKIKDKFAEIKDKIDKINGQKTIEQIGGWDVYNGFINPQTGSRRR